MAQALERERLHHTTKIDPRTARLATIHVPSRLDQFDGTLLAQDIELIITDGKGKFEGRLMVQVGITNEHGGPQGFVYRQDVTYQAFRTGRDIAIDPGKLREDSIMQIQGIRGLWVPLEQLGSLRETNDVSHG